VGDAKLKSFKAKYFFQFYSVEVKCIAEAYFFLSFRLQVGKVYPFKKTPKEFCKKHYPKFRGEKVFF
jgi:hypothetical protein